MNQLHFKTLEEFKRYPESNKGDISNYILEGITEALAKGKNSAYIFQIFVEEDNFSYEVSLPKANWISALSLCMEYFQEEDADKSIETWLVLKKLNEES